MRIGHFEFTKIKQIVVDNTAVWKKNRQNRWIKYIEKTVKGGKSEVEMHDYLNGMYYAVHKPSWITKPMRKYRFWKSGGTINVKREEFVRKYDFTAIHDLDVKDQRALLKWFKTTKPDLFKEITKKV